MSRAGRIASYAGAALTVNALRPFPLPPLTIPSFFGGWLTTELAPHNLAVTATAAAVRLARGDRDRRALAADAVSTAGLLALIQQSRHVHTVVDRALCEALGEDYRDRLPTPPAREDLAVPWRQVAMPFGAGADADVEVVRDVQYAGHGVRHRLDVYHSPGAPPGRPVLLQVHGGAWMIGHKAQQGIPLMRHLAARGWVCVAPNYRLSPRAVWPDHLVDVKRALAWVRTEIERYGGDPSFVAVTGGSAGGHLAAMVALTPNDPDYQPGFADVDTTVQACVPHYGVYDLADSLGTFAGRLRRDRFLAPMVFQREFGADPAAYERASPLLLVGPDAPPFLVLHGAHDTLVPVAEARAFVQRLRTVAAAPVVYAELPGAQHAFDIFPSIRSAHVVRGVELFLHHAYAAAGRGSPLPAG